MGSIELQVLNAVKAALEVANVGSTTRPADLVVYQMREHPVGPEAKAIIIWPADDQLTYEVTDSAQHAFLFVLECRAPVPTGNSAAAAIDPLLTWAWKAITADISLGGLVSKVLPTRKQWDLKEQATTVVGAAVTFQAVFLTAYNDPEKPA